MIELFNILFVNPLINGLVAIYLLLESLGVPYALGFSIIVLTIILRIFMWPLTASQIKMSRKMQELSPELKKLKEKYGSDSRKLQEETMLLYRKHNLNPFGSCVPTIIMLLLFPALYGVFQTFVSPDRQEIIKRFNDVLYFDFLRLKALSDPTFFGLPLGKSPASLWQETPFILAIPLLTAILQFFQSKMMFPNPKTQSNNEPLVGVQEKKSKQKTDNVQKAKEPDFQSVLQTQMIYLIPLTIGFAAYNFPIGLSLYWNTFTVFAMIQQYKMAGLGGLSSLVRKPWKS
jgi:YidC/Oxa1 family membrane protein insertase